MAGSAHDAAPPPPGEATSPFRRPSEPVRLATYAVVLTALGSWSCFARLGEGMLVGDEATMAVTTQIMLQTGDYVVPKSGDSHPHLNAAPLYNWLSCSTAGFTPDGPIRYRLWAGIFGVLCGLAVLALGSELFRPEVGFLAGVLLLLDFNFLFMHSARSGVVETGLLLFVTLMAYGFLRASRADRPWPCWVLAGVCLGGAVLIKPPVMGVFFFAVLSANHVLSARGRSLGARLAGPTIALALGLALALPWYALIYVRIGPSGLDELLLYNSVGRVRYDGPGMIADRWYYVSQLWRSPALVSWLYWPALGVGVVFALAGWVRRGWQVPVLCCLLYVPAISYANVKAPHYLHLVLPFLCILVAAVLLAGWLPRPTALGRGRVAVWGWCGLAAAGVVASYFVVRSEVRSTRIHIRLLSWEYPPLLLERAAEPCLSSGDGSLVLFRFPAATDDPLAGELGLGMPDRFYSTRLPQVRRVNNTGELNAVLAEGKPTAVILPPAGMRPSDLAKGGVSITPDRSVRVRAWHLYYPVIVFNGAEDRLGLAGALSRAEPAGD